MVADVLPETALAEDAVFVPLALLIAAEDYRDGFAVPELGVAEGDEPRSGDRSFASARIYARDLDDVAPLAEHLRSQGVEVVTRARDIETVKAIDRVLSLIFVVLAAIGVAGYLLSLAASLWANVDRKRREIALLRLVGLRTGPVVGFPAVQALVVAAAGILLSASLYAGVSTLFNRAFATELRRDEFVCRLLPGDAAAAVALTLVFALSASAVGGYRATRIDPAESLRDP
jgi:putative ABC transport system permease protein